jgi:uncharacterized protein (TIGR03083 family)
VAGEIRRFAALVEDADMRVPIPTCPGWTLADLVEHVGTINRWATYMVDNLSVERATREDMDFDTPTDPSELAAWLAAGAGPLEEIFAAAEPDAQMWAWGLDRSVRFWPRRMLHETGVHRVDAAMALGVATSVDGAVAADGIDEVLDNVACASYFAPRVDELRGDGQVLRLDATDRDDRWRITLLPDRYRWEHAGGDGNVTVRGTASDLLLALYGRVSPGDEHLVVDGDSGVFTFWLERSPL